MDTKKPINEKIEEIRAIQKAKKLAEFKFIDNPGTGHAIGYTRVSTDIQADIGHSLEEQKQKIEDICKAKGWILDEVFEDPAISGANITRPKIKEILSKLRPGIKVVTHSMDRLSRDATHAHNIVKEIHDAGASIYFIGINMDSTDQNFPMIMGMLVTMADQSRKASNARVSAVMTNMSREGKLRGKPRYGWKMVKSPEGKSELVEDPEEQKVIGIIRDLIEEDPKISLTEIAKILTKNEIQLRKSAKIYTTTLKNIIDYNNLR